MDAFGIPRGGRELRAQAATPYLSGIPDRDVVTLPVKAVDVVITPLIMHWCSSSAAPTPLHIYALGTVSSPGSSLLFSLFHLLVEHGFICL